MKCYSCVCRTNLMKKMAVNLRIDNVGGKIMNTTRDPCLNIPDGNRSIYSYMFQMVIDPAH